MIVTGAEIMFESEIEQLKKHLAGQLPQAQPFVYLHDILESGIEDCYKQSIQAEVDWWIYEEQTERIDHPHFDTSAPELQEIFATLDDAYRQYAQFNVSQLNEAIESAVKIRLNFLCRPRTTLKWFIYRGAPTKTVYEIVLRLAYFQDYNYLITGFHEWAQKTYSKYPAMDLLSVVEFEKIVEKIDNDYILDLSPHQFVDMLIPLFQFFHLGKEFTPQLTIPTEALIVFLDDKGVELIAHEIERLLYNEDMENISQERFLDIVTDIINQIEEQEAHYPTPVNGQSNETTEQSANETSGVDTEPSNTSVETEDTVHAEIQNEIPGTSNEYITSIETENEATPAFTSEFISPNEITEQEVSVHTSIDEFDELETNDHVETQRPEVIFEQDYGYETETITSDEKTPSDSSQIEEVIADFSDIEEDILNDDAKFQQETSTDVPAIEEPLEETIEIHEWEFPVLHSDYDDIIPLESHAEIHGDSLQQETNEIDAAIEILSESFTETEENNVEKVPMDTTPDIHEEQTTEIHDSTESPQGQMEEPIEKIDEYSQGSIEENTDTEPDERTHEAANEIHHEARTIIASDSTSTIDSVEITEDIPIEAFEIYGETPYELDEYLPEEFSVETIEIAPGSSIETHADSPSEIPVSKVDTTVEFAEVLKDVLSHEFAPEPSEIEVSSIAAEVADNSNETALEDNTEISIEDSKVAPVFENQVDAQHGNTQQIPDIAPVIEPVHPEVQQKAIPSIVSFIDKKQHDEFVKKLCSKDEEMFSKLIVDIDNCPAWKEAAQIIDKFFLRHKVDHRGAAAISFRTIVQKRYSGT